MGLDTFAARTPVDVFGPGPQIDDDDFGCTVEDLETFRRAEARCEREDGGCLFGGNYFRGKLYSSLVQHLTGQSLHATWITPEIVAAMSDALDRCDPEAAIRSYRDTAPPYDGWGPEIVLQLRRFFRVCAERGLGLVGSW